MAKMILGIFNDRNRAEMAVDDLADKGFEAKDISIVMRDRGEAEHLHQSTGANIAGGAMSGVATGGVLGGLAGLLIGIGAITIPGVGAVLIGGPLAAALGLTGAAATTLSGAVTGALAGGLVGGLVGLGVPEEEARHYEERVREGGVLVAVPTTSITGEEARAILEAHGAEMLRTVDFTPAESRFERDEEIYTPAYTSEVRKRGR